MFLGFYQLNFLLHVSEINYAWLDLSSAVQRPRLLRSDSLTIDRKVVRVEYA